MRRIPAGLGTLALLALACDPPAPPVASAPAREWPQGTVLAIDELPIAIEEVDAASVWIGHIEPAAGGVQLRRLALIHVILPRALARAIAPAARAEALHLAEATREALRRGVPPPEDRAPQPAEGNWQELGIPTWGAALDLADAEWSDVIEAPGEFVLVRRRLLRPAPVPLAISVVVELCRFPYLSPETGGAEIERAYDEHRLTIVDPAWREIVPERLQYRMGARSP